MRNQGIVLQNYFPLRPAVMLLDSKIGTIEADVSDSVASVSRLSRGALVEYVVRSGRVRYRLEGLEIVGVPFGLVREDILFFHHLIELGQYFLPLHSHSEGIFELFYYLYQSEKKHAYKSHFKKFFLMRFFAILGIYPDDEWAQDAYFNYLISVPIDVLVDHGIDLKTEQRIDTWLLHCLHMHPRGSSFKTIHFLNRNHGDLK